MSPTPEQSARTKQIKRVAAHIVASILDHEEPNVPDDILDIKRSDVERALTSAWGKGRDTERIARQEAERERDDLRSSRPINVPALAARLQSVREMARDAAMARAIEDIIYDMLPRPTGTEGLIEK